MNKKIFGLAAVVLTLAVAARAEGGKLEDATKEASQTLQQQFSGLKDKIGVAKKEWVKKAAACTPNSADPFVPRVVDQWGDLGCLPGYELVNRDYISPSCPGVVINPSCIRGGHGASSVSSVQAAAVNGNKAPHGKAIRGVPYPGAYYPGAIDSPPNVDCGFGYRLAYWGVDQWVCYRENEHDRN